MQNKIEKCYQVKVSIKNSKPFTWRRLKVPSNITFNELAAIIQIVFKWSGYHLYEFEIDREIAKFGKIITLPYDELDDLDLIRGKHILSNEEKIDKYMENGKKMRFVYDLGDDWEHDVFVEKILDEKIENPICIKVVHGPYPEDCGGIDSFLDNFCDYARDEELDINYINEELENYKNFAEEIWNNHTDSNM